MIKKSKGRPGRRKTGRVRNETLSTKLTKSEKSDIVDTARSEGKTQADYIVDIHKEHVKNRMSDLEKGEG